MSSPTHATTVLLLRFLRWLFPPGFRAEYGEEMTVAAGERLRLAGTNGRFASFACLVRIMSDLVASAALEWMRETRLFLSGDIKADFLYALRALQARPNQALFAVALLTIGITSVVVIAAATDAVVLRPLPFPDADRLVYLWENKPRGQRYVPGTESMYISVRPATMTAWREGLRSFQSIGGFRWESLVFGDQPNAQLVRAHAVSAGFFDTLQVAPQLGRRLSAADFAPETATPVVLVSDDFWRSKLGGDRNVVGKTIRLAGQQHAVVGVMPAGFFPNKFDQPSIWRPHRTSASDRHDRVSWGWTVIGRLAAGVSLESAHQELDQFSRSLEEAFPNDYAQMGGILVPAVHELIGADAKPLQLLLAAVALLLLICCANVAILRASSSLERQAEMAVRCALGAPRARLIRQLFLETFLLTALAGASSLLLAKYSIPQLIHVIPFEARLPRIEEMTVDPRVGLFAIAIAGLCAFASGLAPALRATQVNSQDVSRARGTSAGARSRELSEFLLMGEVALTALLLVAGGLLLQSLARLQRVEPGFRADRVIAVRLNLPEYRFGPHDGSGDDGARRRAYRALLESLAANTSVEGVALTAKLPLQHGYNPWSLHIHGRAGAGTAASSSHSRRLGLEMHGITAIQTVSADFFRVLGIPVQEGRSFGPVDRPGTPLVAIVNRAFARQHFGAESAVGKSVTVDLTRWAPRFHIVGVAGDARMNTLSEPPQPELFVLMDQVPAANAWMIARDRGSAGAALGAIRSAVSSVDPNIVIQEAGSMPEMIGASLWRPRFLALLVTLFSAFAALIAATGLFAAVSLNITQRLPEMGVRLALGASAGTLIRALVWRYTRLSLFGLAAGLVSLIAIRPLIEQHLYGVTAFHLPTVVTVVAVLGAVTLIATLLPAWRTRRIDPIQLLRGF